MLGGPNYCASIGNCRWITILNVNINININGKLKHELIQKTCFTTRAHHTYPTIELDANASKSLSDNVSTRLMCPECSKEGSPVFNCDEAITERSEKNSRVRSLSNFSSITSTFKSDPASIPCASGTFALPSCRRPDQEQLRTC